MATKFLEPGGDATFFVDFWSVTGTVTTATDFVHGGHIKSLKYATGGLAVVTSNSTSMADSGSRHSFYLYINAYPSATSTINVITTAGGTTVARMRITTTGVLQLWEASVQVGSNGSTLALGRWYRICLAATVTSTTINRFELFVDAISSISVTNATITNTGSDHLQLGNSSANATIDIRTSDHYIDDSSSLVDTGDIWVTAKRPNANGTINNFVTQIGSGGSGYGTGHSSQVNERPSSNTNGWSVVAIGATTEEYNIEGRSVGDISIGTNASIVDCMGWVSAKSLISETASIIVSGATTSIALTSTIANFAAFTGSTVYPTGVGTDIGIVTDATATTVSLYECGIMVAFIPAFAASPATTWGPKLYS